MAEFSNTITGINSGNTEAQLSMRLKEIVAAVNETGKKGKLTLTLTIEQNKKQARLIEITADVKATIPTPPPPSAAFVLLQGSLVALMDTQMSLPLQPVQRLDEPVEVRAINVSHEVKEIE